MKKMFDAQDMTVGKPWQSLAMFSVPLLVGNIVQQLYNTVDSIVVGRFVGDSALAAVGSSGALINLLLVLFMGIATGAGIMVSQYFGAKDRLLLSKTVGSCITLMIIASVLIMIAGPLVTRPMLALLQTPADVIDQAVDYLIPIFLGIAGMALYNGIAGVLRGMGDALMPLVFLVVACLLNIVLDVWFVAGLRWGIAGAAWATVIAQAISGVLCIIRLAKLKHILDVNLKLLKIDGALSLQLGRLGLPASLTQMIFSLAMIVVQSLVNSLGTDVIACSTIVMRVDGFAMMPNFTFGMAMATFVGQNVGAGKMDRVEQGTKSGLLMGVAVSGLLVLAMLFFGKPLMSIFTETRSIIDMSYRMLQILAAGYIAMAVMQILSGIMRGAGDTMSTMWVSLITTVAIRTPLAYIMVYATKSEANPQGMPEMLFVSLLVSWVTGALVTFLIYRRGAWRKKGLVERVSSAGEL
jgi:putative MATE family efflux protein